MSVGRRLALSMAMLLTVTVGLVFAVGAGDVHAGGPPRAAEALAEKLGIDVSEIRIARTLQVEFIDGCLGLRASGGTCGGRLAEIPSGNVTWLVVGNDAYRYHGSEEFRALQQAAGPFPADDVATDLIPAGVRVLAERLPATGSGGLSGLPDGQWPWLPAAVAGGAAIVVMLIGLAYKRRHP